MFAKLPAASYCLCLYHVPRGLTTLHRWILGNLLALFYVVHLYVLYVCFSKADNLLSVVLLLVHFKAKKPGTEIFSRVPIPFYGRSANNQSILDTTHMSYCYRLSYVQSFFFPHHIRMSVSYSQAGMNVPTFSRFSILLRSRRPHEPSSRPPGRTSSGEVEAGGYGSGRSKRNGLPRVNKSAERTRNPNPATRRFIYIYINQGSICPETSGLRSRDLI